MLKQRKSAISRFTSRLKAVLTCALLICFSMGFGSLSAQANIPTPQLKPEIPHIYTGLSKRDGTHFRQGMRAADNRRWDEVSDHIRRISDPIAKRVLTWRIAVDDPYVSLDSLSEVVHTQSNWPRMTRIRAKSEAHLFDNPLKPADTVAWFRGAKPVSGEGRAALAHAHYQLGDTVSGDKWLKLAWRESKLTRDRQKRIFSRYKLRLSQDDHRARADHLIWLGRRHFGNVNGLLSLMSRSDRALMDARMRVAGNRTGLDAAVNAVPKSLQMEAGLLFERARWRRTRKSQESALPVYLQITKPPYSDTGKNRLWREKKLMSYWALRHKRFDDAYKLSLNHGFTSGANFADAEFLAGWIALRKLNNAELAAQHFATLENGVSLPVSLGRARYWRGRAAEQLGDPLANAYYAQASKYPNVYYSQLASQKLTQGLSNISLPPEATGSLIAEQFSARELIRALQMIGEVQNERTFNQFSFHLDDVLSQAEELTLLANMARDFGYMKPSVRAAKQAGRLDTMLTQSGYPMPDVITDLPPTFDIAFILSVARQESEFNTKATSHANAYGIMQMINSTARATAKQARLPYRRSWLISDPQYAAKLGSQHLHDLLDEFDGSYIMSAAAYNAGPHRVRTWIKTYGDPRRGQIDAIDWVESIPFSETRNYVQRVMENMQVYRARLNNDQAVLHIGQDLTKGAFR